MTYVVPWMSDDMDAVKHPGYQVEPALIYEQPNPGVSYASGIDALRPPRDKAYGCRMVPYSAEPRVIHP